MNYKYIDNYEDLQKEECSICLDYLDKSKEIAILECNHKFHLKCYLLWKNSGKTYSNHCPLCLKKDIEIINIINTIDVKIQKKPKQLKSYKHITKTYPSLIENNTYSTSFDIEHPDYDDTLNDDKQKCCIIL